MLFNHKRMRTWWPLATLITTLTLAGCSDDDRKGIITSDSLNQVGSGEMFHGAEWATIKDLDPRGEQCIDCHGRSSDMSPNGKMAHNIGLQKNDTAKSLGVDGLKIVSVKVQDDKTKDNFGQVTVTLNQPLGDKAFDLTFAKLAPRVIHNRGHDWQNYFSTDGLAFTERRTITNGGVMMLANGGIQPQFVPNPIINGKTITFSLSEGDKRSWGEHDFEVESVYEDDTDVWKYEGVLGTKITTTDIAKHVYCDKAHNDSNQVSDIAGNKSVCWWPDGTHLTSGVFASNTNDFIVAYQPDYTHRVALVVNGSPGHNVWYDFVPSVANGNKTPADFSSADTTLTGSDYITPVTGEVKPMQYSVSEGNRAPGGSANNDTQGHQNLPAAREVVDIQSCNSCHDSLTMHGTNRSKTQTCVTCHNPGNLQAASGRSVDFKQLIHRIHRGTNLPSEDSNLASLMNQDEKDNPAAKKEGSLVAEFAGDFTKVRFPQGPIPGQPEGITNCVKCHMGSETNQLVQALADDIGAPDYNVQASMKLAKVTPQGDNWLAVRNVNACQACHDSNVWFSGGSSISAANLHRGKISDRLSLKDANDKPIPDWKGTTKDPSDPSYQLDKYLPFYSTKYASIGYDWLGKKLTSPYATGVSRGNPTDEGRAGWVHNTELPSSTGFASRFTCGSSGGCHTNSAIPGLTNAGDRGNNNIHRVHLRLTRDFIIAERFAIEISDPKVTGTTFTANVNIKDKKTGNNLVFDNDHKTTPDAAIGELSLGTFLSNGYIGWMHNSPDYNHSAGHNNSQPFLDIPGAPALAPVDWITGKITVNLEDIPNDQWTTIKDDLANVVGTLFVRANFNEGYNLQAATVDFRLDNSALAADEGRRKVVDFTAGNGPINVDNVDGWDKHDGANTQSCSSCHLQLSFHGGLANNVQACVVCHNPQRTDINGRSAANGKAQNGYVDGQYEESLDFKRFVHAIHSAGDGFRMDPLIHDTGFGSPESRPGDKSNSFPGVLSNCQSCHIKNETTGKWTFELDQIPEGMIGSTAITADWASIVPSGGNYDPDNKRSDFDNHLKMTPIASVCSSCHDAGNKSKPDEGRQNANILDGGPYIGSHWWVMGGIAPGIVKPGELPKDTKHQSGI